MVYGLKHLSEVINKFQNENSLFLSIQLANMLDMLEQQEQVSS